MALTARTLLLAICLSISLSGCYLKIINFEGGYIESASSYRDCPTAQTCEVIVDTTGFSETFTAIANPGYEFLGWAKGYGFICGNIQGNICSINLLQNPVYAPIVHSERTGNLMPIFEKVDVASPSATPHVRDANGVVVGSIGGDEGYPNFADINIAGMNSYLRFHFSSQLWGVVTDVAIYFEGDDCDLESPRLYATEYIPEVGPGMGFTKEFQGATHIFERIGVGDNVLVGSRWANDQCEDIADEVLMFPLHATWIAVDSFARPFTRHGPPPCSAGEVEGCY